MRSLWAIYLTTLKTLRPSVAARVVIVPKRGKTGRRRDGSELERMQSNDA
jgi:hypothetical protein